MHAIVVLLFKAGEGMVIWVNEIRSRKIQWAQFRRFVRSIENASQVIPTHAHTCKILIYMGPIYKDKIYAQSMESPFTATFCINTQ